MALRKVSFVATPNAGTYSCSVSDDQSGDYVAAEAAESLESMLRKLVWNVLYGKPMEAPNIALQAEAILAKLPQS